MLIHWVDAGTIESVMEYGILGQRALLNNPNALASAAKSRRLSIDEFRSGMSGLNGPNFLFGLPDRSIKFPESHPIRNRVLMCIEFDYRRYLDDFPMTKLTGLELRPFTAEDDTAWIRAKEKDEWEDHNRLRMERHRIISRSELDRLVGVGSRTWETYSFEERMYAPDVPHIEIGDGNTVIGYNYLRTLRSI